MIAAVISNWITPGKINDLRLSEYMLDFWLVIAIPYCSCNC